MWKKCKPYVYSIIIALAVGGLSALLTRNGMKEYQKLNKPALSPPQAVFPIVWSILFILMGISSAIIYLKNGRRFDKDLAVYAVQLGVNFLWTLIFFNVGAFLFAFLWILLLAALILYMIVMFRRKSKLAGNLQIPYFIWVCFAAYLNFGTFLLNR